MNESTVKTSSCLAITEKRPQERPGGCVGIFLQLFDWNKRFAKKKFFSTKLLTPAGAKQASKKFAVDDKMPRPKLHLTANENNGNAKNNGNTRTPGLVARLMGLESMPAIHRDKPKKPAISSSVHMNEGKIVNVNSSVPSGKDSDLKKENTSLEPRPQKMQRTGPSEKRAVTRFAAESLQIKNVLSRSRKHHHHLKFISPVKSPRVSSCRSSRLIDAATKILEPANRAKRAALTSSSSANYSPKDELLTEEIVIMSPHFVDESSTDTTIRRCLTGQTSCKNCGNLLDVVDSRPKFISEPFVYQDFASNLENTCISSHEQDGEVVFRRIPDQPVIFSAQEKDNSCLRGESSPDRPVVYFCSTKLESKSQKDESGLIAFKHKAQTRDHISLSRDRTPPRPKSSISQKRVLSTSNTASGSKDFVAPNRSFTRTQIRVLTKVGSSTIEAQEKSCNMRDESVSQVRSPARKRRPVGVNRQAETQTNARCDVMSREQMNMDQKNRINGENNVTSFTVDSPLKHKCRISTQEKRNIQGSHIDSHSRQAVSGHDSDGREFLQQELSFKEDALGVLLQQKLKELTSQEDESTIGTTASKRSTAMILQELINALTTENSTPQDGRVYYRDTVSQNKVKTEGSAVELSHVSDHLSPESVLEASFSNDSCFSSSLDDNSASGLHRLPFDSTDSLCDQLSTVGPDEELLDSATSPGKDRVGDFLVTDLLNQTSTLLDSIESIHLRLSGNNAKEVIMHAEIFFAHVTPRHSKEKHLLVCAPLLDTLAGALRTDLNRYLGFEETKEDAQIKGFLFDFLIECLESKCSRYSNSGFKAWRRILPCMNSDTLIQEVGMELMKWTELAGLVPDEIVEWEMSHSLGEWTDFDIETFEVGIEMDGHIFQMLVEEVIDDFCS